MSKNELTTVPLKKGAYEKPERTNPNIPDKKYDKVDFACESSRIGNDGNVYIPEERMPELLDKRKKETRYIVDQKIPDEDKVTINNQRMINSSGVVGYMDRFSHQTRDAAQADLYRYGRDSLTRIGDSDQAEAQRRKKEDIRKTVMGDKKSKRHIIVYAICKTIA